MWMTLRACGPAPLAHRSFLVLEVRADDHHCPHLGSGWGVIFLENIDGCSGGELSEMRRSWFCAEADAMELVEIVTHRVVFDIKLVELRT